MELVVAALAAGTVAWMWHHRVTPQKYGPADPYTVWTLRFTDRQAYRSF
jgi:hypothetical protein